MSPESRKRRARTLGRALIRARARAGHSAQQLHDKLKDLGFQQPPTVRTIQRHENGDMIPWRATWAMYCEVYPELEAT